MFPACRGVAALPARLRACAPVLLVLALFILSILILLMILLIVLLLLYTSYYVIVYYITLYYIILRACAPARLRACAPARLRACAPARETACETADGGQGLTQMCMTIIICINMIILIIHMISSININLYYL